jgi:hypothetical protein
MRIRRLGPFRPALRVGDWLVLAAGLLAIIVLGRLAAGTGGDRVVILRDGHIYRDTDLRVNRQFAVPGPLGETLVEIRDGRVRVKADPGPRQVCVRQGWLGPGEAALCLPNRVSVQRGRSRYDSLNY